VCVVVVVVVVVAGVGVGVGGVGGGNVQGCRLLGRWILRAVLWIQAGHQR